MPPPIRTHRLAAVRYRATQPATTRRGTPRNLITARCGNYALAPKGIGLQPNVAAPRYVGLTSQPVNNRNAVVANAPRSENKMAATALRPAKILDCGGSAFPRRSETKTGAATPLSSVRDVNELVKTFMRAKAAWRFASRRSPYHWATPRLFPVSAVLSRRSALAGGRHSRQRLGVRPALWRFSPTDQSG